MLPLLPLSPTAKAVSVLFCSIWQANLWAAPRSGRDCERGCSFRTEPEGTDLFNRKLCPFLLVQRNPYIGRYSAPLVNESLRHRVVVISDPLSLALVCAAIVSARETGNKSLSGVGVGVLPIVGSASFSFLVCS
jgi:hypothetical protein